MGRDQAQDQPGPGAGHPYPDEWLPEKYNAAGTRSHLSGGSRASNNVAGGIANLDLVALTIRGQVAPSNCQLHRIGGHISAGEDSREHRTT